MKNMLFPDLRPVREGWLAVGAGHEIYWQASGNPKGIPVVWLHGGPGSSASPLHRRFFDPTRYWIIQYDQRGCGRSLPQGSLVANQTQDLIEDLERLRLYFGLSSWAVVGGSWGGALALMYAQAHPEVVNRLLLRSPFLCTKEEIERFVQAPPSQCLESWSRLRAEIPEDSKEGILDFGYRIFSQTQDSEAQARLASAWAAYESAMNAYPAAAPELSPSELKPMIARYRVQCHYLAHQCFVQTGVLTLTKKLQGMGLTLIHGNQDALCPVENSVHIQCLVPAAKLLRIEGAGHDLTDAKMVAAMRQAIELWSV